MRHLKSVDGDQKIHRQQNKEEDDEKPRMLAVVHGTYNGHDPVDITKAKKILWLKYGIKV